MIQYLKYPLAFMLVLWAGLSLAQVAAEPIKEKGLHPASWTMDMDEPQIRAELRTILDLSSDEALILRSENRSGHARHLQYLHQIQGKEVLFSGVNVHIYADACLYQDYLLRSGSFHIIHGTGTHWYPMEDRLIPVERTLNSEVARPLWVYHSNGESLFEHERYRYLEDTIAQGGVFQVNPVNSAGVSYGGFFIDNQDSNNIILQGQVDTVDLMVTYRNDSFFLEQDRLKFEEISAPYHNDTYGTDSAAFLYGRDEQRFEAVNAYYHLSQFITYLDSLGFGSLVLPVSVDVHAVNGADNSQFDPFEYTIEFGDGGVDDAEDGEVVVHEFVHALSTTANYTVNNSKERDAMEEGNCDYLAKSYSRSVNDNNSYKVFSWDGHNQFWGGFVINSTDHYPEDLRNSKDGDRDLWSSTLMCIHDVIGREATDSLVLEHLQYQQPESSMLDMAEVLLLVDSLLFDRRHYEPIKECLVARGLATYGLSIEDIGNHDHLKWFNSLAFASGTAAMELTLNSPFSYRIYNSLGQLVHSGRSSGTLRLEPAAFSKGYYNILIQQDGKLFNGSFVR